MIESQKAKTTSSKKLPRVSVIVPIYNVEKYLPKCLESLAKQTLFPKDFEVILINDASPDNSFQIAQNFAKKHTNVKLLNNEKNLELGRTRNRGIKEAKGEYLYFLDSDDYLDITALETMLIRAYEENADIVTTGYVRVDEDGQTLAVNNSYYKLESNRIKILQKILAHEIPTMSSARLIKKSLFTDNNIFFPQGLHEDVPVIYKLFILAKKTCGIQYSLHYWVTHKGSKTSHITEQHIDDLTSALKSKKTFILKNCDHNLYNKLSTALEESWCKVFQSRLKLIAEYERDNPDREIELYKYVFNQLRNNKEFRNTLNQHKKDYSFLYIFFESFEKYSPPEATKRFKFYLTDKNRLILFNSKRRLKYIIYFLKKYLNPIYKLCKLLKKALTYDGNIFDRINYIIRGTLKTLYEIANKKCLTNILKKLLPNINTEIIFFCDDELSINNATEIVKDLPNKKCSIAITKDLYNTKIDHRIKKYKYTKKLLSKLNIKNLKIAVYFTDKRVSFIQDIKQLRRQNIKTVGIVIEPQDFNKEKLGFWSQLYPFRIFEYVILRQDSDKKFFKDRLSNISVCEKNTLCVAKTLENILNRNN